MFRPLFRRRFLLAALMLAPAPACDGGDGKAVGSAVFGDTQTATDAGAGATGATGQGASAELEPDAGSDASGEGMGSSIDTEAASWEAPDAGGDGQSDPEALDASFDANDANDAKNANAPPSPDAASPAGSVEGGQLEGITAAHNAVRARTGAEPPLPELTWSPEIAALAQQWADELADNCGTIAHSGRTGYGENIAAAIGSPSLMPAEPEKIVEGWASEIACYDYGPFMLGDACDMECAEGLNTNGCGHYTQLIWRKTLEVGCAVSTCSLESAEMEIWVCNYSPQGNFVGQTPY
ncbi:MAG: CAP domain-containing protein [Myxococcales bacterium]|nr:CAP domain-containing protein [Myxococcales bacterium]